VPLNLALTYLIASSSITTWAGFGISGLQGYLAHNKPPHPLGLLKPRPHTSPTDDIYMYIYIHMYIHINIHTYKYICIHISIYIYMYIYMYMYRCRYIYINLCIHMYVYMYKSICTCVYILAARPRVQQRVTSTVYGSGCMV